MTNTTDASACADGHGTTMEAGGAPAGAMDLFWARSTFREGDVLVAAFAAGVACDVSAFRCALARRLGRGAHGARVEAGYDERDPFAAAMVPPAISNELQRVRGAPVARAHRGYSVFIERRFSI